MGRDLNITELVLDEFGRVVLAEDDLERIEQCGSFVTAGGANVGCSGTNTGCTNSGCVGSSNTNCSNSSCDFSTNGHNCTNHIGFPGPPGG